MVIVRDPEETISSGFVEEKKVILVIKVEARKQH
jgi:hypothetical protein